MVEPFIESINVHKSLRSPFLMKKEYLPGEIALPGATSNCPVRVSTEKDLTTPLKTIGMSEITFWFLKRWASLLSNLI